MVVNQQMEAEKEQKKQAKTQRVQRSVPNANSDEKLEPKKKLDDYVSLYTQKTQFFTTFNPDLLEDDLE